MRKSIVFLLLMLSLYGLSHGQYNEKDILSQQAYQMFMQRQYAQAEQLYLQILEKYPGDLSTINQVLLIYFALSQTDKAEALLTKYQRTIPSQVYSEQHIQLLVLQAKVPEAWQESMSYLELNNHDEYRYRLLASYFERKGFYDKVLELYKLARIKLNKPGFFRLEIANASLNYRLYAEAIYEYLAYLETAPVNLFFTNNQLKVILAEDASLISYVAAIADTSHSVAVKEAYAGALVNLKQYSQALNVYKQLDISKLYRFADDLAGAGSDSLAQAAYRYAQSVERDPNKLLELSYRTASISFQQADYLSTKEALTACFSLDIWNDSRLPTRSGYANKLMRLMSSTCLALNESIDSVFIWLDKARIYARDNIERQDTDLEYARLKILNSDEASAIKILSTVQEPSLQEKKDYLLFLGALLSHQTALADTLMNNFIIRYPGSSYTNDAIYLVMLTLGIKAEDQSSFFSAIKLLQMNQKSGLDSLEYVFNANKDEELLLLEIEWAIGLGESARAMTLLDYPFTDPVAMEYTELLRVLLTNNEVEQQQLAKEFLKAKPNSIFSPGFRQRLSKLSSSRPNL